MNGVKTVIENREVAKTLNQYFSISVTLVNETMQANQFACIIHCAGNITNFTENHAGKSFFSQDSKEICS